MFSMNYSMAFPTGDLSDFIDKPSFRGVSVDWRSTLASNPNLALGFDFGWNVFYKKEAERAYTYQTATLYGTQYRYTNSFPMLGAVDYIWDMDKLKPFAGLGIGTVFNVRDNDVGLYRFEDKTWHFALKPEIGLMYQVSPEMGFKVAAKYYQAFKAFRPRWSIVFCSGCGIGSL